MIYLVVATLINGGSPILKKIFKKDCIMFFSAVLALFACLFFVFVARFQFDFNVEFLPYALLFSVSYSICTIFGVLAFKNGSLMITGLIFSFSLLLPTFYGLIAYDEESGILFWITVKNGKLKSYQKNFYRTIPIFPKYKQTLSMPIKEKVNEQALHKEFKRFCPNKTLKDLRHTFTTHARECGVDNELVAVWTGHSLGNITASVYTHFSMEFQQKEALKVNY